MSLSRIISRTIGGKAGAALIILSSVVALWIATYGTFVFFTDSNSFLDYARRLVIFRTGIYYYTSGYPFLIAISGFPFTDSIIPLIAIQAGFAALTPWLAFKTFAVLNRKAGFIAGAACLASLSPYFFETTVFHDGTALFFGFLSAAFASAFFATRQSRYMYLCISSATYAYFAQPGVIGFLVGYAIAFFVFSLRDKQHLKHLIVAIGLVCLSIIGFSMFQKWTWKQDGNPMTSASQIGRRLLFDVYLESAPFGGFEVSGAAGDEMRRELIRYFSVPSEKAGYDYASRLHEQRPDVYEVLFGQYAGRPVELVDQMLAAPNRQYYQELLWIPDQPFGVADRVFFRAALSYIYQHPIIVLNHTLQHLADMTIGLAWTCNGQDQFPLCRNANSVFFYPAWANSQGLVPGMMSDDSYRLLTSRDAATQTPAMRAAAAAWQWIYSNLRPALIAATLIGWIFSFWGPREMRWALGAFVAAYVANMLVFSLFEFPEYRYQMVSIAMSAFSAGAGVYIILSRLFRAASLLTSGAGKARA